MLLFANCAPSTVLRLLGLFCMCSIFQTSSVWLRGVSQRDIPIQVRRWGVVDSGPLIRTAANQVVLKEGPAVPGLGLTRSLSHLRLRGGMSSLNIESVPTVVEVEEIPEIEMLKASLNPKKYPPLEPVYGEDGDMVMPPPMSLENFGAFRRLLDESGRLLTSREAEKQGVTQFKKKSKGRNSLQKRCSCGNKIPCDGNVMITKNEHGKLEYHKIPRYFVGPAHEWECRQPAQYMVTPSTVNKTELLSHNSPLVLYHAAELLGMTLEEAQSYGDPAALNATLKQPCHFCGDPTHIYYLCPSLAEDDEETLQELRARKAELQGLLSDKGLVSDLTKERREELETELRGVVTRVDFSDLYAPIAIEHGNQTYYKNQPGRNTARGECSARELLTAEERMPDLPPGETILYPEQLSDELPYLLRHWPGNKTLSVAPGLHAWHGRAFLKNPNWHPRASLGDTVHGMRVRAREREGGRLEDGWRGAEVEHVADHVVEGSGNRTERYGGLRPRFKHVVRSEGGASGSEVLEREWELQNAALMLGRWLMQPDTEGGFQRVSMYHKAWSHPHRHAGEVMQEFEEEGNEIGERFRPDVVTEELLLVHGGRWEFQACDLLAEDGIPLRTLADAAVNLSRCLVGEPGFMVHSEHSLEMEKGDDGFAYVGIEAQGTSLVQVEQCTVQLTQVAGIRVSEGGEVCVARSKLLHTGCMGGAGLVITEHATARVDQCWFRPGGSASPIWNISAAVEADVSAGARARLHLRGSKVTGRLWATAHRPRELVEEDNTVEEEKMYAGEGQRLDARAQALAHGQTDPVQIWADSRYECWWPRERLEAIGLQMRELALDGNGGYRHVLREEVEMESDAETTEVYLNRSKQVTLHPWGWEGPLEDAYDTESADAINRGVWELREDVLAQQNNLLRLQFRKARETGAEQRRALAQMLLRLQDRSAAARVAAARQIAAAADVGDLAALFWLRRAVQCDKSRKVRAACEEAVQQLSVTDDEVAALAAQLRDVVPDSEGNTNQSVWVAGVEVPVSAISPSIRAALCPTWPLYPQHPAEDSLPWEGETAAASGGDKNQGTASQRSTGVDVAMGEEGEHGNGEGIRNGTFTFNETTTVVQRLRIEHLKEDAKHLPFTDKVELAKAGFLDFPPQEELVKPVGTLRLSAHVRDIDKLREIRSRRVDDWFRIMGDRRHEGVAVASLRDYADAFGLSIPGAVEAQRTRRKLEKELSLTKDYLTALEISSQLHLTELDWRTLYFPHHNSEATTPELYPHLDSERLVEPPSERRIEEIARRMETLQEQLAFTKDEERFHLMEAVYPLAKEVEDAFERNDKEKILELAKRRKRGYGMLGKFADGLLDTPYRISEDGAYMIPEPKDPYAFYR